MESGKTYYIVVGFEAPGYEQISGKLFIRAPVSDHVLYVLESSWRERALRAGKGGWTMVGNVVGDQTHTSSSSREGRVGHQ